MRSASRADFLYRIAEAIRALIGEVPPLKFNPVNKSNFGRGETKALHPPPIQLHYMQKIISRPKLHLLAKTPTVKSYARRESTLASL